MNHVWFMSKQIMNEWFMNDKWTCISDEKSLYERVMYESWMNKMNPEWILNEPWMNESWMMMNDNDKWSWIN